MKKYDKRAFQEKILKLDPVCMAPDCQNRSTVGHHIIYKSKWSTPIENAVGFDRDDYRNGIGLCSTCHGYAHDGLGIGQISGRAFMFGILARITAKNREGYDRFIDIMIELGKSVTRKLLKGVDHERP